jgi:putative ABC transport system permease protein
MLRKLLMRTPIAWFQMTRERTRLLVAIAGISFADVLMFMQLGFKDALYDASIRPHYALQSDLFLINPQFEAFFSFKSFNREQLYQAAAVDGVESVNALYISKALWRNPTTHVDRPLLIFGFDPGKPAFNLPEVNQNLDQIKQLNHVLFDQNSRPEFGDIAKLLQQTSANPSGTVETEMNNEVLVKVGGMFRLGVSFVADGNVIASDSTFLQLFPNRSPQEIDMGLIRLRPGANREQVRAALTAQLPSNVLVLTLEEITKREKAYWADITPIGFIFGLGSIVGFIVGTIIVYQILYADVSDHLPEYATLKAMGYSDRYLILILIQESFVLAVCGFIPGFGFSCGLYYVAQMATRLPVAMTTARAVMILILTLIMCVGSGGIALRKLQSADPAEIF